MIWSIAYELLESSEFLLQYFAANAFCEKIKKDWPDLDPNLKNEIKNALLNKIADFSFGPQQILHYLSVSIVRIGLFSLNSEWKNFYEDISQYANSENTINAFIEIMTVIGEHARYTEIGKDKVIHLRNFIKDYAMKLFETLLGYLNINDEKNIAVQDVKLKSLKCLLSWIETEVSIHEISTVIVETVVRLINENPDVYSTNGIELLASIFHIKEMHKYPKILLKNIEIILQLDVTLQKAIEEGDTKIVCEIVSILSEVGESHISYMFEDIQLVEKITNIILLCTKYQSNLVCSSTFQYWYELQDYITTSSEELKERFAPQFTDVIRELEKHSAYPLAEMIGDEKMEYETFRSECGDCILSCFEILQEKCLGILCDDLEYFLQSLQSSKDEMYMYYLTLIESNLFLWRYVTENVKKRHLCYMSRILEMYPHLPNDFIPLKDTAIRLLGDLGKYMNTNEELMQKGLEFILPCLDQPHLSSSSINALFRLSEKYPTSVFPFFEVIYQKAKEILFKLNSTERKRLIQTLSILGKLLPYDTYVSFLQELLYPFIEILNNLIHHSQPNNENCCNICSILEAIQSGCIRNNEKESRHPYEVILDHLIDPFVILLNNFVFNEPIITQTCRTISELALCMPVNIIMKRIKDLLVALYNAYIQLPESNILITIANLIRVHKTNYTESEFKAMSQEEIETIKNSLSYNYIDFFMELFTLITNKTIEVLTGSVKNDIVIQPDIIKSYFNNLIASLLNNIPEVFFGSFELLEKILQFSINLLGCSTEMQSCKSVTHFLKFILTINDERYVEMISKLREKYMYQLMNTIFYSLSGRLQSSLLKNVANLLAQLVKALPQQTKEAMCSLLNQENYPNDRVDIEKKKLFVSHLYANPRLREDIILQFSRELRGLH